MNDKINQNPDFSLLESSWSESLKQRADVQQNLKDQLQVLQEAVKTSSTIEKSNQKILDQLSNLDARIQSLDALRGELFALQSEKIQDKLDALRSSWNDFFSLKRDIKKSNPSYFAQVQKQLPKHNPKSNDGRWYSIRNITSIARKPWENPIANWMARVIYRLNTKI